MAENKKTTTEKSKKTGYRVYGRVVVFPPNTSAKESYQHLIKMKADPKKHYYVLIENQGTEIKLYKYNEKAEYHLREFINGLILYYRHIEEIPWLAEKLEQVKVDGQDKLVRIHDIPNIKIHLNETKNGKSSTMTVTRFLVGNIIKLLN